MQRLTITRIILSRTCTCDSVIIAIDILGRLNKRAQLISENKGLILIREPLSISTLSEVMTR